MYGGVSQGFVGRVEMAVIVSGRVVDWVTASGEMVQMSGLWVWIEPGLRQSQIRAKPRLGQSWIMVESAGVRTLHGQDGEHSRAPGASVGHVDVVPDAG